MVHDRRSGLSSYVSGLLSAGRTVFTAEEAERALGVGRGAFLDAAERLQRRRALLNPRQGLLKAAELHGATHQAVMEFQVMSAKRLPKIRAGRNLIAFYFRKNLEAVTAGTENRKTDTGTMMISSAALTALDLLRYPQASGGIDNVATVLFDLGQRIDPEQLTSLSALVERPVVQRLGHLLEHLGHDALTGSMLERLRARGSLRWTELDRQEVRDPDFELEPQQRDPRWRVVVRRVPEPDE